MKALINGYYQSKAVRTPNDEDMEEADKVSANIARILNEKSFAFSVTGFTSIHRRLFEGVFKFAGKIQDYDITKKELILLNYPRKLEQKMQNHNHTMHNNKNINYLHKLI